MKDLNKLYRLTIFLDFLSNQTLPSCPPIETPLFFNPACQTNKISPFKSFCCSCCQDCRNRPIKLRHLSMLSSLFVPLSPAFFRSIQMKDLLCPPEVHLCSTQGLGAVSSCSEDWFEFWREFVTDTCVWFVLFCFIHQNFSLIHYFEEFPEVPSQLLHYYSIQNILLFQIFCCLWFQIEPCLTFLLPKFPLNSLLLINKTQMTKVTEKGEITEHYQNKGERKRKTY